jgi:cytochrome oxidase Cu insertion factor (SCO1/SenC/PrrC family)
MAQAPVLNALFNKVASNPDLKDKIKFLAAAQGQDEKVAKMWKAVRKVPFPVVPDTDWKLGKAMNYRHYPVTMLVDKSGKVLWVHIADFENPDWALAGIKKVVK